MKRRSLAVALALLCGGCFEPIPQGLHQSDPAVGPSNLLGAWVRYNEFSEEEYRLVFNERGSFDVYYYEHPRAMVWGIYRTDSARVSLDYSGGDIPHGCRASGNYTFSNVEDELLVAAVSEPCPARQQLIEGVWRRAPEQHRH